MHNTTVLSERLHEEICLYFTIHSPSVLHHKLRSLLLDCLNDKIKNECFPEYLHDFLQPLNDLLDILETAAEEFNGKSY